MLIQQQQESEVRQPALSDDELRSKFNQFLDESLDKLQEHFQSIVDTSITDLAEQIDQNMDFVEQKLDVFTKAIDMQSANIEETFDIKDKDMHQSLDDIRMQIE